MLHRGPKQTAVFKRDITYLPVFLLLVCFYFSDVFLRGAVLAVGDGFSEFYPLMIMVSNQYTHLIFPFWNPYMYSGFPLLGSMQAGVPRWLGAVLIVIYGVFLYKGLPR